jgi:hypothetical protein
MRNHQVGPVRPRNSPPIISDENRRMFVGGRSDKCAVAVADLEEDRKFCADIAQML